jgi:hypothetical protein
MPVSKRSKSRRDALAKREVAQQKELKDEDEDFGDMQWEVDPPAYLWVPQREVFPVKSKDMPDMGKARYMGWQGPPPPFEEYDLNWLQVVPYFDRACKEYNLMARIEE